METMLLHAQLMTVTLDQGWKNAVAHSCRATKN